MKHEFLGLISKIRAFFREKHKWLKPVAVASLERSFTTHRVFSPFGFQMRSFSPKKICAIRVKSLSMVLVREKHAISVKLVTSPSWGILHTIIVLHKTTVPFKTINFVFPSFSLSLSGWYNKKMFWSLNLLFCAGPLEVFPQLRTDTKNDYKVGCICVTICAPSDDVRRNTKKANLNVDQNKLP